MLRNLLKGENGDYETLPLYRGYVYVLFSFNLNIFCLYYYLE